MLLIGALVVAAFVCIAPSVIADAIATVRASRAGEWDFIDKGRSRRDASRQRWAAAWASRRRSRSRAAGGDGTYRPGAGAYLKDVYHGFWERQLEKQDAKAAARPPYVHDPDQITGADLVHDAIRDRVERLRARRRGVPTDTEPDGAPEPWNDPKWDPAVEPTAEPTDETPPEQVAPARPLRLVPPQTEPVHTNPTQGATTMSDWRAAGDADIHTNPTQGATTMSDWRAAGDADVLNNEALRQNLEEIASASADLADALAAAEAARARILAAGLASADGVAAAKFDAGATAAVNDVAEQISASTLSAWHEIADNVGASAKAGLDSLEKYRDAEDLVGSEGIDGKTLDAVSS